MKKRDLNEDTREPIVIEVHWTSEHTVIVPRGWPNKRGRKMTALFNALALADRNSIKRLSPALAVPTAWKRIHGAEPVFTCQQTWQALGESVDHQQHQCVLSVDHQGRHTCHCGLQPLYGSQGVSDFGEK